MAEAFLREHAGDRFDAFSAGLESKDIHPLTRQVMNEKGLDLKNQYSKSVTEYLGKVSFGYLITVCARAEKNSPRTFPGVGQRVHWDFEDPAAFVGSEDETLEKFRTVRDQIDTQVQAWVVEQGVIVS